MKLRGRIRWSLGKRLLVYMAGILVFTSTIIGFAAYNQAQKELDEKGKTILRNAVKMAMMVTDEYYKSYEDGDLSRAEAEVIIKENLMGPLNPDGTRSITAEVDLGENGYLIIYDRNGTEIMHPQLEGLNVWDVVDPKVEDYYLVQKQIQTAVTGGGFVYYNWKYPDSDRIGKKVTFCDYDEKWDWVIVAGSYMVDFDKGANDIIKYIIILTLVILLIGVAVSIVFVGNVTKPINEVVRGMKLAEQGEFKTISMKASSDEIGVLLRGYNQMVAAIKQANNELLNQANRITYLAYNDLLSGMPNRNKFKEHVTYRINSGCENAYFVLLDIKDFKMINSIVGTKMGDEIIAAVGKAYYHNATVDEMIARSSGNEFVIWLEASSVPQLLMRLEAFEARFKAQLREMNIYQSIQFHMAVVEYPSQGMMFDHLIQRVSIAMKFAKEDSYSRMCFYEEQMEKSIESDIEMKQQLEDAILKDNFRVAYQEKVACSTRQVAGVEGLARWENTYFGVVSPAVFIPAINQSHLTVQFGRYMVDKILKDYHKLATKYGDHVTVSINISPIFFLEEHFVAIMKSAVEQYKVPRNRVIVEITEDIFISDFEVIEYKIKALKALGILISLDDFGTGYSSLNYLKNIDIDELKIDKIFIERIISDDKSWILFESLGRMAKAYGYKIVAEGVETNEQLEKVKEAGFDMVQGYIFSKPTFLE